MRERRMSDPLPAGLAAYKRTAIFDETSLPNGLRREHRTRPGVWAVIHVLEGSLRYRILEPFGEEVLGPGATAVARPEQAHEVEPLGAMRMYVEFHRSG